MFVHVTRTLGNVYTNFVFFSAPFVFKLGAHTGQTYERTDGRTNRQTRRRAKRVIRVRTLA